MTLDFMTLGMYITDEIYYANSKPPVRDIPGGAGTYAALGARLFRPPPSSQKVGWIIHVGYDMAPEVLAEIESWETACRLIETPQRMTTRGENFYRVDGIRDYEYITPKLRIDHTILTEAQLQANVFHLICAPDRCIGLVEGILERRRGLGPSGLPSLTQQTGPGSEGKGLPLFVWEPVPSSCIPSERHSFLKAAQYVDVISPNWDEFASIYGETGEQMNREDDRAVRSRCSDFLSPSCIGKLKALIIRAGAQGCYVTTNKYHRWMPAYHGSSSAKVIDPTGGGNTFLGGFGVGLLEENDYGMTRWEYAAVWGSVAASFAIEQIGMPKISWEGEKELWNGEAVKERVEKFLGTYLGVNCCHRENLRTKP